MRNSDVMCGAFRIVHFEVKEGSGSLTFEGKCVVPHSLTFVKFFNKCC